MKDVHGVWIWDKRLPRGGEEDMEPCEELLLDIQRDALEAAAQIAGDDSFHGCDALADMIRKLKP